MNSGIHVSFAILVSLEYMPRSGIAGSYGGFTPSFFFFFAFIFNWSINASIVVLVSAVPQCGSAVCIHVSAPS